MVKQHIESFNRVTSVANNKWKENVDTGESFLIGTIVLIVSWDLIAGIISETIPIVTYSFRFWDILIMGDSILKPVVVWLD